MGTGAPTSVLLALVTLVASINNSEAATARNFIIKLFKVSEKQKIADGSALLDKSIGKGRIGRNYREKEGKSEGKRPA